MRARLAPKTALATLAAVGLFLPFSTSLPAVAGAAPSTSSAAELRECLRASADMHQTTFGGRYVTAEDVARCMEAFRPGSSGSASGGGNASPPPKSAGSGANDGKGLPERFRIDAPATFFDCQTEGNSVSCTLSQKDLPDSVASWSGEITGTLSGMTLTGTFSEQLESPVSDTGCLQTNYSSSPVTIVFKENGTGTMQRGTQQATGTFGGSCSDRHYDDRTLPGYELPFQWSSQ